MTLRTANHNHRRAVMKRAKRDAYAYGMARIERLHASGRLDKRANSGFVRRSQARSRDFRIALATGALRPSRFSK